MCDFFADGSFLIMLPWIHMHILKQADFMLVLTFTLLFWRKKVTKKIGRKLTRTIGFWILDGLCCGGRTIKICSFGSLVPPECC
jgi:hypothetical protein